MTALTAAARRKTRARNLVTSAQYTVGTGAVIYQGGLVSLNVSTKRAVAATAAASRHFLGIATTTATGNTGGTVKINVEYGHEAAFAAGTGLTGGYAGGNVYVEDDNTVGYATGAGTAAVRVSVGALVEFVSSTEVWVAVRRNTSFTGLASG
jgi:hypothetical protein